MLAPILLFVYNRPGHTRRLLDSLLANAEAAQSPLDIYSDAPRDDSQRQAVGEVRSLVRQVVSSGRFATASLVERTENYGLARNVIDGVSHVVGQHGRVIVLEDDLVLSPYFLRFMNDALDAYADEPRVATYRRATSPATPRYPPPSSYAGRAAGDGPRGSVPGGCSAPTAPPCCAS